MHLQVAVADAEAVGVLLDLGPALPAVRAALGLALAALRERLTAERVATAVVLVDAANRLGSRFPGLAQIQNDFFDLWRARPDAGATLEPLAAALGFHLPRTSRG